jgi:hypothetical protein
MNLQAEIASALAELIQLLNESWRLEYDEDLKIELGAPASPMQLAALERRLGSPIPPSYRAFLLLHESWKDFASDSSLLSPNDYDEEWVRERLADLNDLFKEFESDNPVGAWGFPIMLGRTGRMSLFLDKRSVRADGEMDFVYYDATEEQARFANFLEFLQAQIVTRKSLIASRSKAKKKKKSSRR